MYNLNIHVHDVSTVIFQTNTLVPTKQALNKPEVLSFDWKWNKGHLP